jgi:hypothetical protein
MALFFFIADFTVEAFGVEGSLDADVADDVASGVSAARLAGVRLAGVRFVGVGDGGDGGAGRAFFSSRYSSLEISSAFNPETSTPRFSSSTLSSATFHLEYSIFLACAAFNPNRQKKLCLGTTHRLKYILKNRHAFYWGKKQTCRLKVGQAES